MFGYYLYVDMGAVRSAFIKLRLGLIKLRFSFVKLRSVFVKLTFVRLIIVFFLSYCRISRGLSVIL